MRAAHGSVIVTAYHSARGEALPSAEVSAMGKAEHPPDEPPDLDEFVALSRPQRLECSVAAALRQLGDDDRRKARAAMGELSITHAAISKWLALRNVKVSGGTVSRHRKGECSCER